MDDIRQKSATQAGGPPRLIDMGPSVQKEERYSAGVDGVEASRPSRFLAAIPSPPVGMTGPTDVRPTYVQVSLGVFYRSNPVRKACIATIESPFFEVLVLLVILANCICLSLYQPLKGDKEGRNIIIDKSELAFTILFTLEMFIRVIARGLILKDRAPQDDVHSKLHNREAVDEVKGLRPPYLLDGWNVMDFIVVVSGWVSMLPINSDNLSAIRTIRVLRPLRTVTAVKGMRVLVGTMISSVPMIANVMLMTLFLFLIFGVLGVQLYAGVLRRRCESPEIGIMEDEFCTNSTGHWSGGTCGDGGTCVLYENPNNGITNFDNILYAWITIFQCITLEGWTDVMYKTMDATSGWSFLYFIILVFFGSFFLLNLALGVITEVYDEEVDKEETDEQIKQEGAQLEAEKQRRESSKGNLESLPNASNAAAYDDADESLTDPRDASNVQSLTLEHDRMDHGRSNAHTSGSHVRTSIGDNGARPVGERTSEDDDSDDNDDSTRLSPQEVCLTRRTSNMSEKRPTEGVSTIGSELALPTPPAVPAAGPVGEARGDPYADDEQAAAHEFVDHYRRSMESESDGREDVGDERDRLRAHEGAPDRTSIEQTVATRVKSNMSMGAMSAGDVELSNHSFVEIFHTRGGDGSNFALVRNFCKMIMTSAWFAPLVMFLIVVNTVALGMEYHGMSDAYQTGLSVTNIVLTILFALESLIKIVGLGPKNFARDKYSVFDLCIVIVSVLELAWARSGSASVFRTFRVMRLFNLFKSWKAWHRFTEIIAKTISELGNLTIIVLLTVFVFTLVGMQTFGGKFDPEDTPRHNFDTLLWASITVFQILTGEDWNQVMYDSIAAIDSPWACLYFVFLVVMGVFMVLNLFIAILLSNFDDVGDDPAGHDYETSMMRNALGTWKRLFVTKVLRRKHKTAAEKKAEKEAKELEKKRLAEQERIQASMDKSMAAMSTPVPLTEVPHPMKGALDFRLENYDKNARSFFVLPPDNPARVAVYNVVDDKRFELFVMLCIFVSSVAMAVETPRSSDGVLSVLRVLDICVTSIFALEAVLKIIAMGFVGHRGAYLRDAWNVLDFTIVLVSLMSISLQEVDLDWVRTFRVLRVLRPLRVVSRVPELKIVVNALLQSIPGMGHVVMVASMFFTIFAILGMQLFMGMLYACSADTCCADLTSATSLNPDAVLEIPGVDWNADTATGCWTVERREHCIGYNAGETYPAGDRLDGQPLPCEWSNYDANFDNLGHAWLALFEMSTTEGWTALMYRAVDARGVDKQPRLNHREWVVIYFVTFLVIGNFFILNLFIGIILDNFSKTQAQGGTVMLTPEQLAWVETQRRALKKKPKRKTNQPENPVRRRLMQVVESFEFDTTILVLICANTLLLTMVHYEMSDEWDKALMVCRNVFTAIFTFEMCLKLYAMYPSIYFQDSWNRFDFIVVMGTLIGLASGAKVGPNILRIFRIARVFRLVRVLKGLKTLFTTLMLSVPAMINVAGMTGLVFFIFAVLGVSLFGSVKRQETLNKHANFESFGQAMLLLLRMSTGEAWNSIMYECMIDEPDCHRAASCIDEWGEPPRGADGGLIYKSWSDDECRAEGLAWEAGNCGLSAAPLYFVMFIIMGSFIMLNLVIAVVLENFSMSKHASDNHVSEDDIEDFRMVWAEFDPAARGLLPLEDLPKLLLEVPHPLGLYGKRVSRSQLLKFQRALELESKMGFVLYHELLQALTSKAMEVPVDALPSTVRDKIDEEADLMKKRFDQHLRVEMKARQKRGASTGHNVDVGRAYAASLVQAAVRGFLYRKHLREQHARAEQAHRFERSCDIADHIVQLLDTAVQRRATNAAGSTAVPRADAYGHPLPAPAAAGLLPATAEEYEPEADESGPDDPYAARWLHGEPNGSHAAGARDIYGNGDRNHSVKEQLG